MIGNLRKQYLSVPEIKSILDTQKIIVSERYIYSIIRKEGFARLPRREKSLILQSQGIAKQKIDAPKSEELTFETKIFTSQNIGILCLIPYIRQYGIDKIINQSLYPETKTISKLSSILSFLCLKLSNIRRYNADDVWCMDRGMGLFVT